MKTKTFIRKFWRNVYGRNLKGVSSPQVVPVGLEVLIVDDMGDCSMVMTTTDKSGYRRVWREVKP